MKMENLSAREAGHLTIPYDKTTGEPLLAQIQFVNPDGTTYETPEPDMAAVGYTLIAANLAIDHDVMIDKMIGMLPEVVATKIRGQLAEYDSVADAMTALGMEVPDSELVSLCDEPTLLSMS